MTLTPGALTGTAQAIAYSSSARPHRLGGEHHLLVADRRTADVHLAAVDVHAVGGPIDDVDVEVRVRLLAGTELAVPLGVGDALGAAQVVRRA